MAYARDYRQREVCNILSQCQGVEAAQVGSGSSTTDYDHNIEVGNIVVDAVKGCYDGVLNLLALHDGGEEAGGERKAFGIVGQMIAEVAIACCVGTRYYRYAHGEHGDGERFLKVEHSFLLQLSDYCHPLGGHVAKSICGVDVGDNPCKAVCGMEVGRYT